MRQVAIWDLPTRVFHWALVAAVTLSYVTGGEEGGWHTVHIVSGYVVASLLSFRLVWGFVGSKHSRFSDFIYGWRQVAGYAGDVIRLRPKRFVGHNPLGGWMVVAMVVVLAASVVTGLFSGEPGETSGPLLGVLVPTSSGEAVAEVHELFGNIVLALALIHIAAVFLDWALTGENLIPAMVHGAKSIDEAAARLEPPLARPGRGLALAAVIAGLSALAIQQTDFRALVGNGDEAGHEDQSSANGDEEDHREDRD